jgi:hypothetical protein
MRRCALCLLRMIFSENRYTLFRIMLWRSRPHLTHRRDLTPTSDDGCVPCDVVITGKT